MSLTLNILIVWTQLYQIYKSIVLNYENIQIVYDINISCEDR